jgi:hypothetical protein
MCQKSIMDNDSRIGSVTLKIDTRTDIVPEARQLIQ